MSRQARRAGFAAAVALAAGLGGCRDAAGPMAEPMAWYLHDVGGQPLPIVVSTADTGQLALVGEYLTLRPDGSATQLWRLRFQGPPGEYGPPAPIFLEGSRTLRYHRTMAWLEVRVPGLCEGTELCAQATAEGPIFDDELTLHGLQPGGLGDQPRHFLHSSMQRAAQ